MEVLLILAVAVLHLAPVVGVSGRRVERLYGVSVDEPNLVILLRHRAVLFGLLGVVLGVSVWVPTLRGGALVAALVSMGSFLGIAWAEGGLNPALRRVVWADIAGILAALAALGVPLLSYSGTTPP